MVTATPTPVASATTTLPTPQVPVTALPKIEPPPQDNIHHVDNIDGIDNIDNIVNIEIPPTEPNEANAANEPNAVNEPNDADTNDPNAEDDDDDPTRDSLSRGVKVIWTKSLSDVLTTLHPTNPTRSLRPSFGSGSLTPDGATGATLRAPCTKLKSIAGHDITNITLDDLRSFCSKNAIKGTRRMTKVEICSAIAYAKEKYDGGQGPPFWTPWSQGKKRPRLEGEEEYRDVCEGQGQRGVGVASIPPPPVVPVHLMANVGNVANLAVNGMHGVNGMSAMAMENSSTPLTDGGELVPLPPVTLLGTEEDLSHSRLDHKRRHRNDDAVYPQSHHPLHAQAAVLREPTSIPVHDLHGNSKFMVLQKQITLSIQEKNHAIKLKETVDAASALLSELRLEKKERRGLWKELVGEVGEERARGLIERRMRKMEMSAAVVEGGAGAGAGADIGDMEGPKELVQDIIEQDIIIKRMKSHHLAMSDEISRLLSKEFCG